MISEKTSDVAVSKGKKKVQDVPKENRFNHLHLGLSLILGLSRKTDSVSLSLNPTQPLSQTNSVSLSQCFFVLIYVRDLGLKVSLFWNDDVIPLKSFFFFFYRIFFLLILNFFFFFFKEGKTASFQ